MHEAQISKLHDEMARLRETLVECRGKERETQSILNDLRMSLTDLQHLVRLATDLHIYNLDAVPPIHVVSNHVDTGLDTDKLTSK